MLVSTSDSFMIKDARYITLIKFTKQNDRKEFYRFDWIKIVVDSLIEQEVFTEDEVIEAANIILKSYGTNKRVTEYDNATNILKNFIKDHWIDIPFEAYTSANIVIPAGSVENIDYSSVSKEDKKHGRKVYELMYLILEQFINILERIFPNIISYGL